MEALKYQISLTLKELCSWVLGRRCQKFEVNYNIFISLSRLSVVALMSLGGKEVSSREKLKHHR